MNISEQYPKECNSILRVMNRYKHLNIDHVFIDQTIKTTEYIIYYDEKLTDEFFDEFQKFTRDIVKYINLIFKNPYIGESHMAYYILENLRLVSPVTEKEFKKQAVKDVLSDVRDKKDLNVRVELIRGDGNKNIPLLVDGYVSFTIDEFDLDIQRIFCSFVVREKGVKGKILLNMTKHHKYTGNILFV